MAQFDGGSGNDVFNGVTGEVSGFSGATPAEATDGLGDAIDGSGGDDWILGGPGLDLIFGGAGKDRLDPGSAVSFGTTQAVHGGAGDDVLSSETSRYTELFGDDGNDSILGGAGVDVIHGGDGNDTLDPGATPSGPNTQWVYGDAGDDRITSAASFYSELYGGEGDDYIDGSTVGLGLVEGGPGADTLIGLSGVVSARLSYAGSARGVTIDLATNRAAGGDAAGDTISGFWTLEGSQQGDRLSGTDDPNGLHGLGGDDILSGRGGADSLLGGDGADRLFGGDGDDRLSPGSGADLIDGGAGADTVDYSDQTAGVTIDLTNTATGGGAAGDILRAVENAAGSKGDDIIRGNGKANTLSGDDGDDRLFGGDGDDWLGGDGGSNAVSGGNGDDTIRVGYESAPAHSEIDGGAGSDLLSVIRFGASILDLGAGTGTIWNDDPYFGPENPHTIVFRNIERVQGGYGKDDIRGSRSGDTIGGGSGDDILSGLGGNDVLDGGGGADLIVGGKGRDLLAIDSLTAEAEIDLASGRGSGDTKVEGDRYRSVEDVRIGFSSNQVTIRGTDGANRLTASFGDDVLIGGGGNDTLGGYFGNDFLTGGSGRDTFRFDTAGAASVDVVTDLAADEFIALTAARFAAIGAALGAGELRIGTDAQDANDFVIYDAASGMLCYDPDGNGSAVKEEIADIGAGLALHAGNFLIV